MNIKEYLFSGHLRTVFCTAILLDKDRAILGIQSKVNIVIDPKKGDIIKKGGFSFDNMKSGVVYSMQLIIEDNPDWIREQNI
jgi:hypothetical protein